MLARVRVEVYNWAGSLGPFRMARGCMACHFAVAAIREAMAAHPDWPVEFEIKPWLDYLWDALRHGGWHPPVVLVNGRLVAQGRAPTQLEVERGVMRALMARPKGTGLWRRLLARIPAAPS